MHNSLTHRSHSPSNPQEEFLLKILKLRDLFAFYTGRKFTLFTQRHYFTENRKKEKKPLRHIEGLFKSNLIYSHMKNKSVKLPFITKNSKHLVRTICSQMKNKSVKLQFVTKNSKHFVRLSKRKGRLVASLAFRGNDLLPYEKQKCQVTICN